MKIVNDNNSRGMALVITLLVIVVLTVCVTAFMQSMSLERRTSSAYLNILRADEAVQAAEQEAMNTIASIKDKPLAAIYALPNPTPVPPEASAPYLYLARAEISPTPVTSASVRRVKGLPLFSTMQTPPVTVEAATEHISETFEVDDKNASGDAILWSVSKDSDGQVNINKNSVIGLKNGTEPLSIPVNWKYLHDANGQVCGRYAYWCEDESSKLDLRTAGNVDGAGSAHLRGQGDSLSDVSLHVLQRVSAGFDNQTIANLLQFRTTRMGMFALGTADFRRLETAGSLEPAESSISESVWSAIAPYVTVFSSEDERAPNGKRKLDLNALANSSDRLLVVQRMRTMIQESLPEFGKRYYRYNNKDGTNSYSETLPAVDAVTESDQVDYITKICCNIIDFIDSDHQPTVILGRPNDSINPERLQVGRPRRDLDGQLELASPSDDDLPVAFGKESTAYLSEYAITVRPVSPLVTPIDNLSVPTSLIFRFGHYVELSNPSSRTISVANGDLGPNPFIAIVNRSSWIPNGASPPIRPVDLILWLPSGLEIPAGGYCVVSTDSIPPGGNSRVPSSSINPNQLYTLAKGSEYETIETAAPEPGSWSYSTNNGQTPIEAGDAENYHTFTTRENSPARWVVGPSNGSTSYISYNSTTTRIFIGSDDGLIDMLVRVNDAQGAKVPTDSDAPGIISTQPFDNVSQSGYNQKNGGATNPRYSRSDVLSNADVKVIEADGKTLTKDPGGVSYGTSTDASLGKVDPNVKPNATTWHNAFPEYTIEAKGNFMLADAPITSLGDLGRVYDPASVDRTYRPAHRTLRMGQADDSTNNRIPTESSTTDWNSRIWTGGLGSNDTASPLYDRNASRLMDVFRVNNEVRGRINVNGITRSTEMLFDSVTDRFAFNPTSGTGFQQGSDLIAGVALKTQGTTTNLTAALKAELVAGKFFLSAADWTQLPIFSTYSTTAAQKLVQPTRMSDVSDAGKEEYFRRTSNLVTVNPLTFTIYSIGQAGGFNALGKFRVKATKRAKTIVSLVPTYAETEPTDLVSPTSWSFINRSKIDE